MSLEQGALDYERVEAALRYLEAHRLEQPSLDHVAARIGLGPHHFQRLFVRWAGVSPKRFLQHLTKEHAKACLAKGQTVLSTALEVGLSGPGRLHDLLVETEGVSPGEVGSDGAGLQIRYGVSASPFGACFMAVTDRGLCRMSFLGEDDDGSSELARLRSQWPKAELTEVPEAATRLSEQIFVAPSRAAQLRLYLRGTKFQLAVWEALLRIPEGRLMSYGELAKVIGDPNAARAVGHAVGQNPVSYLVPCHRVIRSIGELGNYRWGRHRKAAMVGFELSKNEAFESPDSAPEKDRRKST